MATTNQPRHEEIADYLRTLAEERGADERMPSDAELCDRFGVSRMTARQRSRHWSTRAWCTERAGTGPSGRGRRVHRLLGSPLSFTENMRRRGLEASSTVLAFEEIVPSDADRDALAIDDRSRVILLERLRFANDVPMAIERAVISPICREVLDNRPQRDLAARCLRGPRAQPREGSRNCECPSGDETRTRAARARVAGCRPLGAPGHRRPGRQSPRAHRDAVCGGPLRVRRRPVPRRDGGTES